MIKVKYSIYGHHTRQDNIDRLQAALKEQGAEPSIFVDTDDWGPTKMLMSVMHSFTDEFTHNIQLQDDVLICKDFVSTIQNAISAKPDMIISPFMMKGDIIEPAMKNKAWHKMSHAGKLIVYGQGWVTPKKLVYLFWQFYEDHREFIFREWGPDKFWSWDDALFNAFIKHFQLPVWATVPCLIEHDDRGSLLNHNKTRKAPLFLGDHASGLAIDFKRDRQMVCDSIPVFDSVKGVHKHPLKFYKKLGHFDRNI